MPDKIKEDKVKIKFFVDGVPYSKQSFRASKFGHGYQTKNVKTWQGVIAQIARIHWGARDPVLHHVYVKLIFHLESDRADLDNLTKAVNDGLQGVIMKNDKQIKRAFQEKIIDKGHPGVEVTVATYRR